MKKDEKDTLKKTAIGAGSAETVNRYGSASAEHLKALRGVDQETGKILDRSLRSIAKSKINPEYRENNISQQAGYSAEVAKTAKDNARNIIDGKDVRVARTEDVEGFGKNHPVADHIEISHGTPDPASISQMKFVNHPEDLLDKIARGSGGGKNDLSRYMENDAIDLPTEQVAQAKAHCRDQVASLRNQAKSVEEKGKKELAEKFRHEADNYEKLEEKIRDSGLSREQARNYRLNPEWETAKDIAGISHSAGIQGAQIGAVIGGSISLAVNAISLISGEKDFEDAALSVLGDTGKASALGYTGAFVGSAAKAYMQQSSSEVAQSIAKTAIPALAVTTCISMGASIYAFADGSINASQLLEKMGGTLSNTLASSMGATVAGQVLIPVPVLGALVGGLVASTLSGMFYQAFVESGKRSDLAQKHYEEIKQQCDEIRAISDAYRQHLEITIQAKLSTLKDGQIQLIRALQRIDGPEGADDFAASVNDFAALLGKQLVFSTRAEYDEFMEDKESILKF